MNKRLWGGIILTALVVVGIVVGHNKLTGTLPVVQESATPVIFYDQSTGASVPATFYADRVTFTDATLGTMTLPQTISADGGRYANTDESIVFWNKGNSVFITQNGIIVFNGSTDTPKGKLPAGSAPAADPKALVGTWIWQKTVLRDAPVVTPKKVGTFSLSFMADGRLTGTTDCNSFAGTYKTGSDSVIQVTDLMSTLMYCMGSQESVFTDEVTQAFHYSFDAEGSLLINFNNDAGSIILKKK